MISDPQRIQTSGQSPKYTGFFFPHRADSHHKTHTRRHTQGTTQTHTQKKTTQTISVMNRILQRFQLSATSAEVKGRRDNGRAGR